MTSTLTTGMLIEWSKAIAEWVYEENGYNVDFEPKVVWYDNHEAYYWRDHAIVRLELSINGDFVYEFVWVQYCALTTRSFFIRVDTLDLGGRGITGLIENNRPHKVTGYLDTESGSFKIDGSSEEHHELIGWRRS